MLYTPTLFSILEVLIVTLPALLTVAFTTIAERKTKATETISIKDLMSILLCNPSPHKFKTLQSGVWDGKSILELAQEGKKKLTEQEKKKKTLRAQKQQAADSRQHIPPG